MRHLFWLILICFTNSACTPVGIAVGAGATLGIAAAQEGGLKTASTDTAIRIQIYDRWFKQNVNMYRFLDITVKEGRVLITGTVPNSDMRVDAVRLAWQSQGVRQVINEINVSESHGLIGFITDGFITGGIRTKLTLDRNIQSINYSIDTVDNTVYLMGIAQTDSERERVLSHARRFNNVDSVVSYVRLRGETPAGVMAPTSH